MKTQHFRLRLIWIGCLIFSTLLLKSFSYGKGNTEPDNADVTVVNINTAAYEEILTIPFVGPGRAKAIMEYREKKTFKKKADLMKIKGIGPKIFKKIAPYVSVSPPIQRLPQ